MYKLSVITPFHNVDMEMFEKACQSMRAQTIGFENIQWIIVAHNCEPQYMPQLNEMFKADENVIVKELNNEARTPSSPRNYGLAFATAPYVGFLDGDDSYLSYCLEEALLNIQDTKAQVLCFRREFELEREGLMPITEKVMWNQTLERVVIERGHWDDEKMFTGIWGMVTSRLFDRQFLEDHHIRFDEEVPFTEDLLFCAEAMAQADRICYLPQLIGYHYFINGGSLVQAGGKSAATLLSYARGFSKIFSRLTELGIDFSDHLWLVSGVLAGFMMTSPDLTTEVRQEIKMLMAPYITNARHLKGNKIWSQQEYDMNYMMANIIMTPESDLHEFFLRMGNGEDTLRNILTANKDTDYGQRHGFDRILAAKGYQNRVPLASYDNYKKLIRLQTNIGETGILTREKAERYVQKRSGKILPMTKEHVAPYNNVFAKSLRGHRSLLLMSSRPLLIATGDMAYVDSLESILVKDFFSKDYYAYGKKQATVRPSVSTLFNEQQDTDYYNFMLQGIQDKAIDQIVALTTADVLKAFQTLEARWQEMMPTIAQRDEARAEELQAVFEAGFEGVARRIWPQLQRVVAFGAGRQAEATEAMKHYTEGTPHNSGYYITAEALIAHAIADDSDLFELTMDNNFFEFLPTDGSGEAPLLRSELQAGKTYQLVVTNRAGLYRFVTKHLLAVQQQTADGKTIVKIAS